jgi:citrate lyase beta subunit
MEAPQRVAPTYRSIFFIPANRQDRMLEAPKFVADALAYDLEDAVPTAEKDRAREAVQMVLAAHAAKPFGQLGPDMRAELVASGPSVN